MGNGDTEKPLSLHPTHPDFIASERAQNDFTDACATALSTAISRRNQERGNLPEGTISNSDIAQAIDELDSAFQALQISFSQAHRQVAQKEEDMYLQQKQLLQQYSNNILE